MRDLNRQLLETKNHPASHNSGAQTTKATKSHSNQAGFSEEITNNLTYLSEKQKQNTDKLKIAFEEMQALRLMIQTDCVTHKDLARQLKDKVGMEEVRQALPDTDTVKLELRDYIHTVKNGLEESTTEKVKGVDARLVALRVDTNVEAFKLALQKKANGEELKEFVADCNSRLEQTELSLTVTTADIRSLQQALHSIQKSTLEL